MLYNDHTYHLKQIIHSMFQIPIFLSQNQFQIKVNLFWGVVNNLDGIELGNNSKWPLFNIFSIQ